MPGDRKRHLAPQLTQPFTQPILEDDQQRNDQDDRQVRQRNGAHSPATPGEWSPAWPGSQVSIHYSRSH
jgi:hypothetical protein